MLPSFDTNTSYQVLEDLDSSNETVTIENDLFSEFYVTYNVPKDKNPKTNDNIAFNDWNFKKNSYR